jgi:hypothetical protein
MIANFFEEEINNKITGSLKYNLQRKVKCPSKCNIFFFDGKKPFKNDDVQQKDFLLDLGLLIVKNNLPLQFAKSVWFKCLITTTHLQIYNRLIKRLFFFFNYNCNYKFMLVTMKL